MSAVEALACLAAYFGVAILLGRLCGLGDRLDAIHKAEYLGLEQLSKGKSNADQPVRPRPVVSQEK